MEKNSKQQTTKNGARLMSIDLEKLTPLETIKSLVQNAETFSDLQECNTIIRRNQNYLRRVALQPNNEISKFLYEENKESGVERYIKALERLENAPLDISEKFSDLERNLHDIERMNLDLHEIQYEVDKKMKDLIWEIRNK